MSNKLSLFKKLTLLTLTTSVTIGCSDIFSLSLPSNSSVEINSLIDSVSELSEIISSSIYSETSIYVSSEYISESLSSYIDSISSSEEWVSSEELSSYLCSEISSSSELSQEELSSIISESISEYISSESYSEDDYSSEILSSNISSFYSSSSVDYYSFSESEYYSSSSENHSSSSEYYYSSEDTTSEYYSSSENTSGEYYSSSEQSSSEHYSLSEDSYSESFSYSDSVTSIDDGIISDYKSEIEEAVSPIIDIVYTSLIYELSYLGYEVYYAKLIDNNEDNNEEIIGFAYASYDKLYSVKSNNVTTIIVPVGFISLHPNLTKTPLEEQTYSPFETDYKAKEVEIYNNTFTDRVTFFDEERPNINVEFDLLLRDTNIKNGHFVSNKKYVQYQYRDEDVDISIQKDDSSNYVLRYGSIYDYDKSDYVFIPYKEIPSDPITFTSIAGAVNLDNMENAIENFLKEQEDKHYTLQTTALFVLDADYLYRLTASLKTKTELNGVLLEKLKNLEIDETQKYVHFKADGSFEIRDLPQTVKYAYEAGDKASILKSFSKILLVAGGLAVGIALSTFAAPYGGVALGGLVLGAVGEFASQTLLQKRDISDVNWLKVGVSAVCSSLLVSIPLGSSVATTCAGLLSSGLVGAGKEVLGALTDPDTITNPEVEDLVIKGATGAAFSMIFYGIRTLKYGGSEQQPSKPKEPKPLEDINGSGGGTPPNLFRRTNVKIEVYDSQDWEMIKSYFGETSPYEFIKNNENLTKEVIQKVCNDTSYVAQSAFHDSLVKNTSNVLEETTGNAVKSIVEDFEETLETIFGFGS